VIESEEPKRSAVLEFLSGLFSGIGIILLTLLFAILAAAPLEKILVRGRGETHMVAIVWALLAFGLGLLAFRYRTARHRQASFSAGLVTAAALFFLLESACWNFSLV
jgi:uncharacterized membrane protein